MRHAEKKSFFTENQQRIAFAASFVGCLVELSASVAEKGGIESDAV
jgi:hypothetical protein